MFSFLKKKPADDDSTAAPAEPAPAPASAAEPSTILTPAVLEAAAVQVQEPAHGTERSFIMIKPDGVQRGLVGHIVARFEAKGFQLLALRQMRPSREHLEKHYADLSSKGFFASLIEYMVSSPVVAMVWAGDGVVKEGRKMLGATKPSESAMGTIRGDYCVDIGRNVCHGSDSVESAEHEIALWFPDGLAQWSHHSASWVSEAAAEAAAAAGPEAGAAGEAKVAHGAGAAVTNLLVTLQESAKAGGVAPDAAAAATDAALIEAKAIKAARPYLRKLYICNTLSLLYRKICRFLFDRRSLSQTLESNPIALVV